MTPILKLSLRDFCHAVKTNHIFADLEAAFRTRTGGSVSAAERASWHGSLPRLSGLLELCDLPDDVLVGLEVQIPYYSERIDAVLYGHDAADQPAVLLIELKQWSEIESVIDGRLMIRMRNGLIAVVHPSLQVDAYRRHLLNFVKAFHSAPSIQLSCCVYAHNYPTRAGALFDFLLEELGSSAPIFCSTDVGAMVAFIRERMMHGNGISVAEQIRFDGLSPSRLLIEAAGELIRDQNVFTMLDEQIPAQKSIVDAISRGSKSRKKSDPRKKKGNDQRIPLLDVSGYDAYKIIEEQGRFSNIREGRIFPYNGRSVGTAFRRECGKLKIKDLHFHDLRHEGTSRLFEAGFSIEQVALVTGHKDWKMLRRYTHLKPETLHSISSARVA
jgi:hypothetical protein